MKRMLAALAAVLFVSLQVADAQTVKRTFDIDDFYGVSIDDGFDVILEHTKDFKIVVEVTEEFLPYLLVKNRDRKSTRLNSSH